MKTPSPSVRIRLPKELTRLLTAALVDHREDRRRFNDLEEEVLRLQAQVHRLKLKRRREVMERTPKDLVVPVDAESHLRARVRRYLQRYGAVPRRKLLRAMGVTSLALDTVLAALERMHELSVQLDVDPVSPQTPWVVPDVAQQERPGEEPVEVEELEGEEEADATDAADPD